MFLILTIFNVWYFLIFAWYTFDHPFSWGNFGAWRAVIFSPTMLTLFLLWFLGAMLGSILLVARAQSGFFFFNTRVNLSRPGGTLLSLVDIPLLLAGLALAIYGGVAGQLAPLMLGIILTSGL